MKKYRVVLADDHPFLLEGIATMLREMPQLEIVATVKNGFELMEAMPLLDPHLVLLDLNMPGYDGFQCLQKIKTGYPGAWVIVLTSYSQPEFIEEIKKLRADGYVVKDSSAIQLKEVIGKIINGKKHFPEPLTNASHGSAFFVDGFLKKYSLTKRELDIIRLVCREMSTKEMAAALFLSELTINTHRRNILRKLDIKNVAGLVNFAKEHQLI
jgi:DNA-binding NarL/FixJ family response regulator